MIGMLESTPVIKDYRDITCYGLCYLLEMLKTSFGGMGGFGGEDLAILLVNFLCYPRDILYPKITRENRLQ